MEPNHTLDWLDTTADKRVENLLSQIQEAREAHRYPEAIRLCESFIKRADDQQEHAALGLVYCQLGETYRLMGAHHYRDAVDAFGKARVHFALEGGKSTSDRNKGIAYWSQAIVLEQLPGQWNGALKNYQSALDCVEQERDQAQLQSSSPRSKRDQLLKDLSDILGLIEEDYDNLLKQQTMGDPKIAGLLRELAATEERLGELTDIATKAALAATRAAQQAFYAARAAGAASGAADSASRKTTRAANQIQATVDQVEKSASRVNEAANRIEDNSTEATNRIQAAVDLLEKSAKRVSEAVDRIEKQAPS